ncbi:MAG: S-formylglutathione hydrolase [Gluconacetobacter diazotrophicus]|nr:S-formylglutathione hydrolase [Gluconacetobacter diazotrophicus]
MAIEQVAGARCFGGEQRVYRHRSEATGTDMRFGVFLPPQAEHETVPALWFLAGLGSTEANFSEKAGAQRVAAELGLALVTPDTSPRGEGVPDDPAYDLGQGAGFYLDATEAPWAEHFRMERYVARELPAILREALPIDGERQAISGHSMGGHGALTLALRHPGQWRSVSAFAPIAAPTACPWGEKAFGAYLGADRGRWRGHDACALIADGARLPAILVDQGEADPFLREQLGTAALRDACAAAGIPLELRMRPGYDHSYFFVASFIAEHLRWHARALGIGGGGS